MKHEADVQAANRRHIACRIKVRPSRSISATRRVPAWGERALVSTSNSPLRTLTQPSRQLQPQVRLRGGCGRDRCGVGTKGAAAGIVAAIAPSTVVIQSVVNVCWLLACIGRCGATWGGIGRRAYPPRFLIIHIRCAHNWLARRDERGVQQRRFIGRSLATANGTGVRASQALLASSASRVAAGTWRRVSSHAATSLRR